MSKTIQVALTSFGMSGQVFHGPTLKVNSNFQVKKVLERTKNFSVQLFPEAKIVRSYENILNDKEIELVIVNTPDTYHFEMCRQALNAGKHVVVEKPFTQTSEQAKELIQLAKQKGKIITIYQNRRWDGDFLTAKKIIEDGLLGRVVEFESHYDRFRPEIQQGTWKEQANQNGGVLYNLGTHMIDQALVLFGKPNSVTAHFHILRTGGQVDDYYDIRLQYDGFAALLKCSYLVREPGPRYSIHGTNGSFQKWGIDPQEEALKNGELPVGENWGKEPENNWGILHTETKSKIINQKYETLAGNYNIFYENVYNAITNDAELLVKPEEAKLTMEIMELCLKSNQEKRTVFVE